MTRRDSMLAVFDGRAAGLPPVSVRLDLWHADAVARGALPAEIRGMTSEQVEDRLGFCRAARHRAQVELKFRGIEVSRRVEGGLSVEEYGFPGRPLVRKTHLGDGGMSPYIVQYPLQTQEDYERVLSRMDDAFLDLDVSGFADLDARTGDAGLPVLILHACPAHTLMLRWAGYEHFYMHLVDFPERVEALIRRVDELYRRDLWPAAGASSARLVLHGTHFSTQMTPPRIFDAYFLSYFSAFNDLMHRHGKKAMWHADAQMGALLSRVVDAGFDAADCLATTPLVPERIEDYFEAWQGRIVCWGGLPSTVFDSGFPLEQYRSCVDHLVAATRCRSDFIFGASDHVMPGADWERLLYLAQATGSL